MNGTIPIPLENTFPTLSNKLGLEYFSNSKVEEAEKIQEKMISDKFELLEKNIGSKLSGQLSYEQKKFIVNISGTINLGKSVDINTVYNLIEKIENE